MHLNFPKFQVDTHLLAKNARNNLLIFVLIPLILNTLCRKNNILHGSNNTNCADRTVMLYRAIAHIQN